MALSPCPENAADSTTEALSLPSTGQSANLGKFSNTHICWPRITSLLPLPNLVRFFFVWVFHPLAKFGGLW